MQRVERETADHKICLEIGPWNFFQNYFLRFARQQFKSKVNFATKKL